MQAVVAPWSELKAGLDCIMKDASGAKQTHMLSAILRKLRNAYPDVFGDAVELALSGPASNFARAHEETAVVDKVLPLAVRSMPAYLQSRMTGRLIKRYVAGFVARTVIVATDAPISVAAAARSCGVSWETMMGAVEHLSVEGNTLESFVHRPRAVRRDAYTAMQRDKVAQWVTDNTRPSPNKRDVLIDPSTWRKPKEEQITHATHFLDKDYDDVSEISPLHCCARAGAHSQRHNAGSRRSSTVTSRRVMLLLQFRKNEQTC